MSGHQILLRACGHRAAPP